VNLLHNNFDKAFKLFKKQIECIINDDRKTQMNLYSENLNYKFPFANDRPNLIKGRESFERVMTPLWEKSRKSGVKVIGCKHEFHGTDEPELFLAIFSLEVVSNKETISLPIVQLIRIEGDYIIEIEEYFNPGVRQDI